MNLSRIIFFLYISHLLSSPNIQISLVPVSLCHSRSRGRSSFGLYSGRGNEAARLSALPQSTPQSCSGLGRSSGRSSSGPYSRQSSEAGMLPLFSGALARAAPGQARAAAGAAPGHSGVTFWLQWSHFGGPL
jgi:hypothetical protein